MAAKKKKTWGGKRAGAGAQYRVSASEPANVRLMLAVTQGEYDALELARLEYSAHVPMASWLVKVLLDTLMVPCKQCGAPFKRLDGFPLYAAAHVCQKDD